MEALPSLPHPVSYDWLHAQHTTKGAGGFAGDTLTLSLADKAKGWTAPKLASDAAPSPRGWYAYATVPSTGAFLVCGGLAPDNSRWVVLVGR